jgi:hypothetical protein
VDEKCCTLHDSDHGWLKSQSGLTVLCVAALGGHVDIMHYLVHEKGAKVEEILDARILQRAMHALLVAPGRLPAASMVNPLFKGSKSLQEDLLFSGGLAGLEERERVRQRESELAVIAEVSEGGGSLFSSVDLDNRVMATVQRDRERERERERQRVIQRTRDLNIPTEIPLAPQVTELPIVLDQHVVVAAAEPNVFHLHYHSMSINGATKALVTEKGQNKTLCSQAVMLVDSFVEEQRSSFVVATNVNIVDFGPDFS